MFVPGGNKYTNQVTASGSYELRIDLTDTFNNTKYAKYKTFVVADANSQYKLTIGGYSGNAGNSLYYHNGLKFSTTDRDNDLSASNCAKTQGPWWLNKCASCDLNSQGKNTWFWVWLLGHIAKTTAMMIRKI